MSELLHGDELIMEFICTVFIVRQPTSGKGKKLVKQEFDGIRL